MGDPKELPREIQCNCGDEGDHVAYRSSGRAYVCPRTESVQTYKPPAATKPEPMSFREIVRQLDDDFGKAELRLDASGKLTMTPVDA